MWFISTPCLRHGKKRALPNLGLQHLQFISGKAEVDVEGCLAGALRVAKQRVVLKRRRKDPVSGTPSFQLKGQAGTLRCLRLLIRCDDRLAYLRVDDVFSGAQNPVEQGIVG